MSEYALRFVAVELVQQSTPDDDITLCRSGPNLRSVGDACIEETDFGRLDSCRDCHFFDDVDKLPFLRVSHPGHTRAHSEECLPDSSCEPNGANGDPCCERKQNRDGDENCGVIAGPQ